MIGTLGAIVFQASTEVVMTFKELSRSGQARIHKHMVISQKPRQAFGHGHRRHQYSCSP